jgi:ribosomal protein L11 methyltransferase
MHYWQYQLTHDPALNEIIIALLADTPFDTFEETEQGVVAYLPATDDNVADAEAQLMDLQDQFELAWAKTYIEGQNWNEIWESNFHPVIVRDWCAVRADFHPTQPDVRHELVINPRMAFGTGHHETTWMCLSAMEYLPITGRKLLDFGCGTGVLAILAAQLGAREVEAIDIESESYLNTLDNAERNHVAASVVARQGILTDVQGTEFDGILANINRHIILDGLPRLAALTVAGGWLLVSGILLQDEAIVTEAAQAAGYQKEEVNQRGNWLCIRFVKN